MFKAISHSLGWRAQRMMGLGKGNSNLKHGNCLVSMLDFWGV